MRDMQDFIPEGVELPESFKQAIQQGNPIDVEVEDEKITFSIQPNGGVSVKRQHIIRWPVLSTLIAGCIIWILAAGGYLFIQWYYPPQAVLTLQPDTKQSQYDIRVVGIPLLAEDEQGQKTVDTTGLRTVAATQASGYITFYNGLFGEQVVAAGTTLTALNGIHVVTDQTAYVPANNPPSDGVTAVSAHTIQSGNEANIASYAIDGACCGTAIKAINYQAFSGGQDAYSYSVVSEQDITTAAHQIEQSLEVTGTQLLYKQVQAGDSLAGALCKAAVKSSASVGQPTKQITVSVLDHCTGLAYQQQVMQKVALQQAMQHRPKQYMPIAKTLRVLSSHASSGTANVYCQITYEYVIPTGTLTRLFKDKPYSWVSRYLQNDRDIIAYSITWNGDTLPDTIAIHVISTV